MKLSMIVSAIWIHYCLSEKMMIVDFQKTPHVGKNPVAELAFENTVVRSISFCINIRLHFKYHKVI